MQACHEVELFDLSEMEKLRGEVTRLKKEIQNTRKGLFSRFETSQEEIQALRDEVQSMKNSFKIEALKQNIQEPQCKIFYV